MKTESGKNRGLKICCGITALLFIIILVVLVVLFLTILKPKEPKITPLPVSLESFKLGLPSLQLNVSLGVVATIDNRNYGGFKYEDSTTYLSFRGTVVAEGPIEHGTIPARGKHNVSTTVEITTDKLILNPYFWLDFATGRLNFTSSTTMHGKVIMMKFLKFKATTYSTCDISVLVHDEEGVESICHSRVHF